MGSSNSKSELNDGERLVEELKAGFSKSRALLDMLKDPVLWKLWNKDGNTFFYYALNRIVQESLAKKIKLHFMEQKRLLDPDNEEVPALKDLKNRQLRLSLIVTTGMEVEVLKEWKDIDNQLYEKLVSHFNRNSTPLNIFNYYFNIPERKESQNFKEYMEDSFVVSQTRRNMILMGKTEEEIEKEVEALKKMWERKDTQFVVKMVLAPCGALSPALKIGTALSRLLNLKFMRYGNNHAALQIGPYLISWFDDSIVHIDVMSSNKALLCLYPSDKPDRCFITRALATDNLQNSTFGKNCL